MQDLNLLRILVAVHECQTVTAAASRLNMSQPTVSQALSRLRDLTGDPLFLRGPQGMSPTAHATHLYRECATALHRLDHALRADEAFVPAEAKEHFTIALSDLGEMTFLPPLAARLASIAPSIRLDIVPLAVHEVEQQLKLRQIDFAVGNLKKIDPDLRQRDLFEENYVALIRKDHPTIGDTLSLEAFLEHGHAVVTGASEHWQVSSLATVGGSEPAQVHIVLPHFTALPFVIGQSNLIGVLPSRAADSFSERFSLRWLPLPFVMPNFKVRLLWHGGQTLRSDARNWMVDQMSAILQNLQPCPYDYHRTSEPTH
ncbi:LysR family transcriptional regulator [Rhizobium sp. C4]|uniref:LysR family transcriptional regulator n=1 Tax=Rhizobium sp. C4 TaxID=1349800 RepID=UPI001E54A6D6|nr:LysR family transcriptional regulator [Rhizobium sp. C4]MCD2171442.1 LysR family transcriptional regulator [Rhizobium sp. C4]